MTTGCPDAGAAQFPGEARYFHFRARKKLGDSMTPLLVASVRIVSPARCWRGLDPFSSQRIPSSPDGRLHLLKNRVQDRFASVREAVHQPASPTTAYRCVEATWIVWAPCTLATAALFSNQCYIAAHRKDSHKAFRGGCVGVVIL